MGLGRYLNRQIQLSDGIRASGNEESPAFLFEGNRGVHVGQATYEGATRINDDTILSLGTDDDIALIHRTTILGTNTALTGVLVGTPVTPAVAANSLILSNVTANGDILISTQTGGNSAAWAWIDTSANLLTLYAVGVSAVELGVGLVTINEGSADIDFRVEAANNANALVIDGGTDSVALGRAVVAGAFLSVDGSSVNRAGVTSVGRQVHIPAATITQTNANPTTLAIGAGVFVGIPTFDGANAGQTLTDSASVYISGEPAAGSGNMTLTRVYSLWVDAGTTALDGRTIVGGNLAAPIHDINVATLVAFNEQGSDIDFRVESDNNPNALLVDAGTDSVGFGNGVTAGAFMAIAGDTNARAMTTTVGMNLHFPLVTLMSNNANPTTIAIGAAISVLRPSFDGSNAGQTTSDGAAVYIQNSPAAGSANMTITRAWSIWVDAGNSRFDGNIDMSYLASDILMGAATAAALEISDGTTKFVAFDTRVTTVGVTTIALDISDYTLASATGAVATGLSLAAHTLNLTGNTQVTTQCDTVVIGARTIAADGVPGACTVDEANSMLLVAPTEGLNAVITACSALRIIDGGGTPVNQYGIFIETLTAGATADYAIWVAGANAVHLGTAGTATGLLEIDGATSGTMTLTVPAATTSYTLTLPAAANTNAGYQLTCAGADTITSWGAAASVREAKDIMGEHEAQDALDKMLAAKVYDFHYKPGKGTQDSTTQYVGVMADEAPWAMHYAGGIVNPVNTLGYTVLAFQAMAKEIAGLKKKLAKMGAN